MGQSVHERVGGRIVPLPERSEQRSDRAETDEEIEWALEGLSVQVPGSARLRIHHPAESFGRLIAQDPVVQKAGHMKDASQWR